MHSLLGATPYQMHISEILVMSFIKEMHSLKFLIEKKIWSLQVKVNTRDIQTRTVESFNELGHAEGPTK
jgi:hypothetical protein